MKNLTFFIVFLFLSSYAFGQKQEFKQALEQNTILSIENFIKQFPDCKYIPKANKQLEFLKYQHAINKNTIEDLSSFLEEYPNSKYTKKVNLALEPLFYEQAKKENSIESYQKYIDKFPKGKNLYSVSSELKKLRYNDALEKNTKEVYAKYLKDFPNDFRSKTITQKLIHIEFVDVKKEGSIEEYKEFVKKYPNSQYSKELSKIINKDDPKTDFTPEKYFSFKLRNPSSPALNTWKDCYKNYLYDKAKSESYSYTDEYSKYLTFSLSTENYSEVITKVLSNVRYGFAKDANFILATEYKKKEPNGKYVNDLSPEKIAGNELTQLKDIYISGIVESSIARATNYGVNKDVLKKFHDLKQEIIEFEKIDIRNFQQCKIFLEKYPSCPYSEVIRKEVFEQKYFGIENAQKEQIEDLVFWLPASEAPIFYNAAYKNILATASSEMDSIKRIAVLTPWITCPTYKFNTLEEKLFTADLFSWYALMQLRQNNMSNAAICYLTAAAITHTCFNNIQSRYFTLAFDFSGGLDNMQSSIQDAKIKLQNATSNIKQTRELLYTMGLSSYYFGESNFLEKLLEGIEPKNEQEEITLQSAKEKAKQMKEQNNTVYNNSVSILSRLFEVDKDCWPSLRAFIIYPEKKPLKNIVLMPRFYDYEDNIEEYLTNFKDDALLVAKEWLKSSDNKNKIERSYYILGYFKEKFQVEARIKLSDENKYWCYYNIRIGNQVAKYKELLIKEAASEDRIALVLYNRISSDDVTPPSLKKWLDKEIDEKKYNDNVTIHIFYKVISNMKQEDKTETINRMYNSYNMKWNDVASKYYKLEIPDNLSESYVKDILEGSIPYKKLDLIKYIAKNELAEFNKYVELYLVGHYYTAGDGEIIRRNLKNMYTKDIVVGYNQQINYSAVNSAVNKSEKVYKSLLIQMAISGLDILDFEKATSIIKKRFLLDDNLCLIGTEWILKNYDKDKVANKPTFDEVVTSSQEQKAAKSFLEAYFSDTPDFAKYTKQCQKLTDSDKWVNLVTINAKYGNKISGSTESTIKIASPVNDWDLSVLNTNIKQRYLDIINK